MRFMMIIRSTKATESGEMPSQEEITAMMNLNEQMVKAGVLLDGAGLHPSSAGALIQFSHGKSTVTDGPFAEAKELIAGYWIIQVKSKAEAIEWARRVPHGDEGGLIELRQVFESPELTDDAELLNKEAELRAQSEQNRK